MNPGRKLTPGSFMVEREKALLEAECLLGKGPHRGREREEKVHLAYKTQGEAENRV